MVLRLANVQALYLLAPLFAVALLYRFFFKRMPIYQFPLVRVASKCGAVRSWLPYRALLFLRVATLSMLGFLVCQPEWVDERSAIKVSGVDMVLAMDLSFSMQAFDDLNDPRQRIEVAKEEAARFIQKRHNDQIGIVIFGSQAVSLCPLTLDKNLLKEMIGSLAIGTVDPQGTALGTGIATAVNRLRSSKAKSRVIVLLTDGAPTPPEKVDVQTAIELARSAGIKIYAVGIGAADGGYCYHPLMGAQRMVDGLNMELLDQIAQQTGGKSFRASNPRDMRLICQQIDELEKTEQQSDLFARYYQALTSFIFLLLGLFFIEVLLRYWWWKGVLA